MADEVENSVDPLVVTICRDGSLGEGVRHHVAHRSPGVLHLAVSIQVVDTDRRWLLQRRAATKAAFAGLWGNTCCTHPRVGEDPQRAGIRRLGEEMGLEVRRLLPAGAFVYRATDPASGLVEHELDHVFVAVMPTGHALADPDEIAELARLPYAEALRLVTSDEGVPWAGEVLRRSFSVLEER